MSNCPKCGEALVDELIEAAMEYANEHGPDEDYRRWAKEKLDGAKAACVAMVHTLTQDFADQRRRAELAESMLSHREEELTFVKAALDTALRDTARLDKAEVSNPTASSDHPFALQDASPERERLAGIRPDLCATIDEHVALTWDCVPARRSEVVRSICETWARRLQLAEAAARDIAEERREHHETQATLRRVQRREPSDEAVARLARDTYERSGKAQPGMTLATSLVWLDIVRAVNAARERAKGGEG